MSQTKQWQEGKEYFCDYEQVSLLQDYNYSLFTAEEEADWNELKTFLNNQTYDVCCSRIGFDNFVNRVIMEGHTQDFIKALDEFSKKYPRTIYHLLNDGKINLGVFV